MKLCTLALMFTLCASLSARNEFPKYPNLNVNKPKKNNSRKELYNFMKPFGKNYKEALFKASSLGYINHIRDILDILINPDVCDYEGKTPLAFAAESGQAETCRFLIDRGATVDARTNWGSTPLMWAAQNGHVRVCKMLIKAGAKVDAKTNEGKTALMYAAERGHTDVCHVLLKHGACVDARTQWGSTALMWATQKGHLATCKLLVNYGADVYARTYEGKSVLDYASGYYDVCTFLKNQKEPQMHYCEKPYDDYSDYYCKKESSTIDFGSFCTAAILGTLVSYWLLS